MNEIRQMYYEMYNFMHSILQLSTSPVLYHFKGVCVYDTDCSMSE